MKFQEPEVIEMGNAKELVELYDPFWPVNAEGLEPPLPSRPESVVYISDAE